MDNGLSDNLPELLATMDEHGFDEVILETVGAGQSEHAVRSQVDTLVLVVIPETGDVIQTMKAGIMELPNIYVVKQGRPRGCAEDSLRDQAHALRDRHAAALESIHSNASAGPARQCPQA